MEQQGNVVPDGSLFKAHHASNKEPIKKDAKLASYENQKMERAPKNVCFSRVETKHGEKNI